jgi:hypothetical protein
MEVDATTAVSLCWWLPPSSVKLNKHAILASPLNKHDFLARTSHEECLCASVDNHIQCTFCFISSGACMAVDPPLVGFLVVFMVAGVFIMRVFNAYEHWNWK